MLITILIGNNLVNIAAASLATVLATAWFGHLGPGLAVGVLTVLILIFGEITPKSFATRYSERISLFIAPFILGLMRIMFPLVWLFDRFTAWVHHHSGMEQDPVVTESELIRMAGHGEKEGTIEQSERVLIERIFAFNDLTVRDVMTPQSQVFALEGTRTVSEILDEVMAQHYSRIPIYLDHPDEILNIIYLRDLLSAVAENKTEVSLKDISHKPVFVSEYQPIDELIATLRRKNRHMAVVVDEYGTTRGVVTMEDLMEELVGEIYDESDAAPSDISHIEDGVIQVGGTAETRVVEEYFKIDLPGKPTDTVSYWILSHTERIPELLDSQPY
jgi:CBS domain containing-hemolysin-like protein